MARFFRGPVGAAILLSIPLLMVSAYLATRDPSEVIMLSDDPFISRNRSTNVGGIDRPISDFNQIRAGRAIPSDRREREIHIKEGEVTTCPKVPRLTFGVNVQMDSVLEAMQTQKYPERLSPLHSARPFDVQAWKQDKTRYRAVSQKEEPSSGNVRQRYISQEVDEYLNVSEPGRIYDVLQPEEGIPVLVNTSSPFIQLVEGESSVLKVQTLPRGPATFTAFGMGKFETGLTSITVVADEQGIASATFTGTNGHNYFDIVSGSPVVSGTIRFQVEVLNRYVEPEPVVPPPVDPPPVDPPATGT